MSPYDDSHRLFVQAMLTKRIIPEESAKALYAKVCQATQRKSCCRPFPEKLYSFHRIGQPKEYQDFLAEVNKELDLLDFSLKVAHAESDGSSYLAFVNGKGDFFTESATRFKPAELSYCRELVRKRHSGDDAWAN